MNTPDVALAIEAWAADTVTDLNTYDREPEDLAQALPLVVADVQRDRVAASEPSLPNVQQYQQTAVRVWDFRLTVMVSPENADTLEAYVDALTGDLIRNINLGERVQAASPFYTADYPGEVEHPSGVVARAATITMTIGERLEVHGP